MTVETRRVPRHEATKVHAVMVHPDRRRLSYDRAMDRVARKIMRRRLFDLKAEVADTSEGGIRVRFRGQRFRAQGLLRADEKYWFMISLRDAVAHTPQRFIRGGDEPYMLLRAICRWHRPGGDLGLSTAGFVLDPDNDPELVAFVASGLGEQHEPSETYPDDLPFGPT